MRIVSLQNNYKNINTRIKKVQVNPENSPASAQQVYFQGLSWIFKNRISKKTYFEAKNYLKLKNAENANAIIHSGIESYDLDKLNGIQKGIKVFKGLSMKKIAFASRFLTEILPYRGCSNQCSHCYANALPQNFKNNSKFINSMLMEDFYSLIDGFSQLSERLGFKIIMPVNFKLFYDSDCIETELLDKKGNIYDFVDVYDLLDKKLNIQTYFNTTGWFPTNEKHQKRAEKFVDYFLNNSDSENPITIQLSVNPFHGLYEKSLELSQKGDLIGAKRNRNLYTDRIANAIYTFTPILDKKNFNFIFRINSQDDVHNRDVLTKILDEVLIKVRKKYIEDYNSSQKYIKSFKDIDNNELKVIKKMNQVQKSEIAILGRAKKMASGDDSSRWSEYGNIKSFLESIKSGKANKIIDANGKVYSTNGYFVAPTDIQFNFSNKKKKTVPLEKMLDIS